MSTTTNNIDVSGAYFSTWPSPEERQREAWRQYKAMAKELAEGAEEAQAKRAYFERVKAKKAHTWTGVHQPRPKPGQAFHHCRKHQYGWNKSRPIDCRFATLDESTGAIRFDSNAAMAERDRVHDAYVQLSAAYAWDKDGVSWPDVYKNEFSFARYE
ncbi:hypothetical protein BDB00DRAFT_820204 [Zychaea mexicana]|uniref:uncharacterized protein n=1 Tax=Zychaea mexicana TaxID=64656 RepID=UPI0022FE37DE|nr:uncharacterized protein BDB00DRAFT_820204 [Zychaea mexicana]KAI9493977.1 hypothetical protein BDB00DRAFT_820204 [Zychaea mexicana]